MRSVIVPADKAELIDQGYKVVLPISGRIYCSPARVWYRENDDGSFVYVDFENLPQEVKNVEKEVILNQLKDLLYV